MEAGFDKRRFGRPPEPDHTGTLMVRPTLLLLSADREIVEIVTDAAKAGWRVAEHGETEALHSLFAEPNVRLVLLDDEAIEEAERGRLLTQIRRRLPAASLLYVAGNHDELNEKRARTGGAHYYVSKPLALERFAHVLQSFMRMQQAGAP
jgi:DNA-binding response OmpR family regulator